MVNWQDGKLKISVGTEVLAAFGNEDGGGHFPIEYPDGYDPDINDPGISCPQCVDVEIPDPDDGSGDGNHNNPDECSGVQCLKCGGYKQSNKRLLRSNSSCKDCACDDNKDKFKKPDERDEVCHQLLSEQGTQCKHYQGMRMPEREPMSIEIMPKMRKPNFLL